jgi:hypothetical protein
MAKKKRKKSKDRRKKKIHVDFFGIKTEPYKLIVIVCLSIVAFGVLTGQFGDTIVY